MSLLRIQGASVHFGGLVALGDLDLEVHRGETVAVIGPNGAGKTTMFNAVSGLQPLTAGRMWFADREITRAPAYVRARLGMGRTFQRVQIFGLMSVQDNVLLGAEGVRSIQPLGGLLRTPFAKRDERRLRSKADRLLDMLDIGGLSQRRAGDLPLGVLRRVELARALAASPQLLLLDEPASGMDEHESVEFAELLNAVRPELGVTTLIVEHDMHVVNRLADFVYVLDFGRLIAKGEPAEIAKNEAVLTAYLGVDTATDARMEN